MLSRSAATVVGLLLLVWLVGFTPHSPTKTNLAAPPFAPPPALPADDATAPLLLSSAPDYPDAGLQAVLDSYIDDLPGNWAVSVKKLDTGQYAAVNAHVPAVTASLYKVWVFYEVMHQRALGNLSLDDTLPITDGNAAFDVSIGELHWNIGDNVKISTLLQQMIDASDNTAAITLVYRVGPDTINASLQQLGLPESSLNFGGGDNLTTASDYTHLLELLATGRLIDRNASRYMVDLLLGQQLNDLLPVGLPNGTPFAHKTGTLDYLMHDAGLVYGPGGPYAITVLSWNLPDYATGYDVMPRLSRAVYQYFNSQAFHTARYFPETRQVVGAPFVVFYNTNGGRTTFGLPIAPETQLGDRLVQYFERARLERPLAGGPVALGPLGSELISAQSRHFDATAPANPNDPDTQWFAATRQAIGQPFLDYWRAHGAQAIFGLPISNIVVELQGGQAVRVQYFERARFELHGDNIVLGALGSELLSRRR